MAGVEEVEDMTGAEVMADIKGMKIDVRKERESITALICEKMGNWFYNLLAFASAKY